MRLIRVAFLSVLTAFSLCVFSQSDTVKIKVLIIDGISKRPLMGVSVINPKSGITQATDGQGELLETIDKRDTLFLFYPGYKARQFSVADSALKKQYSLTFLLEPFTTGLKTDVVIKAPKTLEQIEEERKKLGITPKELERPEIVFTSPISALYDVLSRRAKEREKLKTQITEDERRKIFKELLNYYNERKVIDLPEDHYDDFINFCNLPLEFLKNHTDYEIMKTISTMYEKYARLSGLVK
ncbi:MAG TPA: hypothetical protein VG603_00035 [Chitinophagales bacterium]|nr:hypothetical protein [Chitinophagales bacterium]